MNMDSNSTLSEEYAFFDGKRNRVRNYLTIAIHVYHPLLRRIIRIASMDISSNETTESMVLFFEMLNSALKEATGNSFNPVGFVCDEGGANHKALEVVYGNGVKERTITCLFHFEQCKNRYANALAKAVAKGEEEREVKQFKKLAKDLVSVQTIVKYDIAYTRLTEFISKKSYRKNILQHWLELWHIRRVHVVPAFKLYVGAPQTNMSETYHSTYTNTRSCNLILVDALYHDASDALLVEAQLKEMFKGNYSGGTGPSQAQRKANVFRKEQKRALSYSDDLRKAHAAFKADTSSHRADKKRKERYDENESDKGNVESDEDEGENKDEKSSSQSSKKQGGARTRMGPNHFFRSSLQ